MGLGFGHLSLIAVLGFVWRVLIVFLLDCRASFVWRHAAACAHLLDRVESELRREISFFCLRCCYRHFPIVSDLGFVRRVPIFSTTVAFH